MASDIRWWWVTTGYPGITWHCMTLHDITWHDLTWHDMTWHDITCHYMTLHDIIWHYMTLRDIHQTSESPARVGPGSQTSKSKQPFLLRSTSNCFEAKMAASTSKHIRESPAWVGPCSQTSKSKQPFLLRSASNGFEAKMAASTSKPTCQFSLTSTALIICCDPLPATDFLPSNMKSVTTL